MVVFLSLLIALVGMLMYLLAGNIKIQELGRVPEPFDKTLLPMKSHPFYNLERID